MLAACVAVMYHPDDAEKYAGKFAVTPLFGARVPMIADEAVDKEKGTGVVMCCTFGDEQDINWWRAHKLDTKIILNKYGKLDLSDVILEAAMPISGIAVDSQHSLGEVENDVRSLSGLKVAAARTKIIEMLEQGGHTAKPKKPIKHMVKCAERSGAALEIIPTEQWFIKIVDKKEQILAKIDECNWFPSYMQLRAEQWTENLSWDWCISRQRYFGVPFPVWYKEDGEIVVAQADELPINPLVGKPRGYENIELTPDMDVMDTWATSSISPQLNSHFGIDPERHAKLFPADMRPQAHEIIRTWAFYTIVKALLHEDVIPWKNLMISGWCLAEDKNKMSKSKGNVITPVPLIEEKSADVVRYWASNSSLGADIAYSEDVLKIGKKLVNKLWNVCKFASMNLTKIEGAVDSANCNQVLDCWILTRLNKTIRAAEAEFDKFEYSKARQHIEDFFWNDFCDNYLEIAKARAYGEEEIFKRDGGAGQQSALHTISICVDKLLRLWAPFVPHVADELHDIIFGKNPSLTTPSGDEICIAPLAEGGKILSTALPEGGAGGAGFHSVNARGAWPLANLAEDERAEKIGIEIVEILEEVRKFKSEKNASIKFPIKQLNVTSKLDLSGVVEDLKAVTSSLSINLLQGEFNVFAELADAEGA
jgi:valyl-tRNA synthetase